MEPELYKPTSNKQMRVLCDLSGVNLCSRASKLFGSFYVIGFLLGVYADPPCVAGACASTRRLSVYECIYILFFYCGLTRCQCYAFILNNERTIRNLLFDKYCKLRAVTEYLLPNIKTIAYIPLPEIESKTSRFEGAPAITRPTWELFLKHF